MSDNIPEEELEETTESKPRVSGKTLLAIGFVASLVVLETCLFFFMVPSSDEVTALIEARLVKQAQQDNETLTEVEDDENRIVEFTIGVFGETFSPLGTERQYRVEYKVFGTLRHKNKEKMSDEYTQKEGRLRHAIRMVIRNSRLEELQDNQLGLIERRILATCNSLLEEPFLISVGFDDYQVREE